MITTESKKVLLQALRLLKRSVTNAEVDKLLEQRKVGLRTNIISPKLCDDVIHRLGPSLDRYQGCDLIDLNPGLGIWSTKLHERLRPRRHLLVESDVKTFSPYLKSLLSKRDSEVRLISDVDTAQPTEYHKLLEHLPDQTELSRTSHAIDHTNPSLLLVGSLPSSRAGGQTRSFRNRSAMHAFHYLAKSIEDRRDLHRHGLVRMLLWFPSEHDRALFFDPSIVRRTRFSLNLEKWFEKTEEIAGTELRQGVQVQGLRLGPVQRYSMKMVDNRSKELGIRLPPDRALRNTQIPNPDITDTNGNPISMLQYLKDYNLPMQQSDRDWIELYNDYISDKFPRYVGGPPFSQQSEMERRAMTEFDPGAEDHLGLFKTKHRGITAKYMKLEAHRRSIVSRSIRLHRALELTREARMLVNAPRPTPAAMQEFNDKLAAVYDTIRAQMARYADEWSALRREVPLMLWERREAEPLLVGADEVFPANCDAHLIDFQPRTQPGMNESSEWKDGYEPYDVLLELLLKSPSEAVAKALDDIYPGAAQALIPQVPEISDPTKGGNHDLGQMRVRMLTMEMLRGLDRAWKGWVFRPTRTEVFLRLGGGSGDAAFDDGRDRRYRMAGV